MYDIQYAFSSLRSVPPIRLQRFYLLCLIFPHSHGKASKHVNPISGISLVRRLVGNKYRGFCRYISAFAKYKTVRPARIGDFVKIAFFLLFSFLFFFFQQFSLFPFRRTMAAVSFVPLGSSYRRYSHERNIIIFFFLFFFPFFRVVRGEKGISCVLRWTRCNAVRSEGGGFPILFGRPEIDDRSNHSTSLGM